MQLGARRAKPAAPKKTAKRRTPRDTFDRLLLDFAERLAHVTVLDPACGSGNFLYVAINLLLDLNKEVIAYAANHGLPLLPQVRPTQLLGIEINPYAQQLAQVVIWIGYLQWMHDNGFTPAANPVLEPIDTIELRDAILDLSDPAAPREPDWPAGPVGLTVPIRYDGRGGSCGPTWERVITSPKKTTPARPFQDHFPGPLPALLAKAEFTDEMVRYRSSLLTRIGSSQGILPSLAISCCPDCFQANF